MRIAIDALSVTNLSGRRVLLGHLGQIAAAHRQRHQFLVLVHSGNQDLVRDLGPNVHWRRCAGISRHWSGRLLWHLIVLPRLLHHEQVDLVLNPSGCLLPAVTLPQIVLAQNPWCFVPAFHRTLAARFKAALQRRRYRQAQTGALGLYCNSAFLAGIYARNAGGRSRDEAILANGIDTELLEAGLPLAPLQDRAPEILTVSVMTPHKSIEVLIDALALLHRRGVTVSLRLVGPWADPAYRRRIAGRITALALSDAVHIQGQVSDAELHTLYRRCRVFALLSGCESFGLPAVEAQAFGTPVVVAAAGAPPDVVGPGGLVVPPGDPEAAASALGSLLTDSARWWHLSLQARRNAEHFQWRRVSQPLVEMLARLA